MTNLYTIAADVQRSINARRSVSISDEAEDIKKLKLANLQAVITEKLSGFLDEALLEANKAPNAECIGEIEVLRESLMDSVEFDDIRA